MKTFQDRRDVLLKRKSVKKNELEFHLRINHQNKKKQQKPKSGCRPSSCLSFLKKKQLNALNEKLNVFFYN